MRQVVWAIAIAAAAWTGAAASAAERCGAETHSRYGETRAFFQDTLGACRSDGSCSAVLALADPTGQTSALQQLRIASPAAGAPLQVELMATTPMPREQPTPMVLEFARARVDIANVEPLALNEFRVADAATAQNIVNLVRAGRTMLWTYETDAGPHTARFGLRGVTAALAWIGCMQAETAAPAE